MVLLRFALEAARAGVVLGLALAAMPLLRGASSAARRLVLALALGGALVLPGVAAIAPALRVEAPAAVAALGGAPFVESLEDAAIATPDAPREQAGRAPSAAARPGVSILGIGVAAIWAVGALLVLARLGVGIARTRTIVRRAGGAPEWALSIARAERATGFRAVVAATDELDGPAVTGLFAPVVLVPRSSGAWTEERRHAVLLHEIAHVRQADCLVHVVAQIACAAHWFNPLAWMALRRLRVERELAADDAVITAGACASRYAEDLLALAGAAAGRDAPPGTLGMAERSELSSRITAIVASERPRRPLSRAGTAGLVSGAAATLFAVACATPAQRAPEEAAGAPSPAAPSLASPSLAAEEAPRSPISTIDPRLQAVADEELDRALAAWGAAAGTILVLDPGAGEILANAGRERGAPADLALHRTYAVGSTLKPVTLAAALEEGVVTPEERIDCEGGSWSYGGQTIRDGAAYGSLTLAEMMAVSSNIGFSKVFDRLGGDRLGRWLRAFHFDAAPPIEGAASGEVPPRIANGTAEGAAVAIGASMPASPLQLAAAYATFANDGAYVAPTLTRRTAEAPRRRLISKGTARAVVAALDEAVNGARATGAKARIAGARVAGKTGTSEGPLPGGGEGTYASFVGLVPEDHPRFVILVGIEEPRDGASGGKVAAPVFARVATRALGL